MLHFLKMFSELYHSALGEMFMWDFFGFGFFYILYLDDSVHQKKILEVS